MSNYKYLILYSLLSSILQTGFYALLLLIASSYLAEAKLSFVIGTALPLIVLAFFVLSLIQNLIIWLSRNEDIYVLFVIFGIILVLPFIANFNWFSPIIVLLNGIILYLPFSLRKYLFSQIEKKSLQ